MASETMDFRIRVRVSDCQDLAMAPQKRIDAITRLLREALQTAARDDLIVEFDITDPRCAVTSGVRYPPVFPEPTQPESPDAVL